MFNQEEKQYIVNALNELTKQTGLQNAGFALTIIAKLQEEPKQPSLDLEDE